MDIEISLIIVLGLAVLWSINLRRLFKKRGFDPSLVTFADPFTLKRLLGYRLLLLTLVLAQLMYPEKSATQLIALTIATSALVHIAILYSFNRQQTQPAIYYFLVMLAGLTAIGRLAYGLVVVVALSISAELAFGYWTKTSQRRYDRWVAGLAKQINHDYHRVAASMPPEDWHWVLHIAVTEAIARPKLVRQAERLYFHLRRPAYISTGIMQIRDSQPISDVESVRRGAEIIRQLLPAMPAKLSEKEQLLWLARHYNGSGSYVQYLLATKPGVDLFHFKATQVAGVMHVRRHR